MDVAAGAETLAGARLVLGIGGGMHHATLLGHLFELTE